MTDTINTLADPGSDPAHEWQQPENAETILHAITPASLLAHADWFDTTHGPGSVEARSLRNNAARLEAESAREVEVLQFAKRLVQEEFGGYNQWHDLSTSEQERRIQYVKFILAFLAADGRLLPEVRTVDVSKQVDGDLTEAELAQVAADLETIGTPPAVSVPDSGPDGTPEKPEKWAVLNPDTNTIGPEVFWSWDEADKRGGYGRVVRVDGDKA